MRLVEQTRQQIQIPRTRDCPLLVPAPFLSSVPLHGMTLPFLSDRNPLESFLSNLSPCFSFRAAVFIRLKSVCCPFQVVCILSFVWSVYSNVRGCVCVCVRCPCVRVRACTRTIVSTDKVLRFYQYFLSVPFFVIRHTILLTTAVPSFFRRCSCYCYEKDQFRLPACVDCPVWGTSPCSPQLANHCRCGEDRNQKLAEI